MERNPESERFVQVAQAEDPFTADALEAVLRRAGMAVLRTDHPGGSGVEALGSGWALPWFELSVLEEHVARARDLVEAEAEVHHRHREFGGVDGAELKCLEYLAGLQQLRRYAEILHHVRAQPEEAHLQPLQIVQRLDLFAEPARCLGRDQVANHGVDIVLGV